MPNDPSKVCLKVDPSLNYRSINLEPCVLLGRGGYGAVFYSRRANAAVKVIALNDAFRWELAVSLIASSAARRPELSDIAKHFLQVYAFSTVERMIVMEYMKHDLRSYLDRHRSAFGPSTLRAFAREFKGLSKALAFFHVECGLMHLDIKHDNILVNCDPETGDPTRLVLADFSLASVNGNSFLNKCCMVCPKRHGLDGMRIINTDDVVNSIPSEDILLYRVEKRPPEFLIDYCNGARHNGGEVMDAMTSLAMDLFALGHVTQEVALLLLARATGEDAVPKLDSGSKYLNYLTMLKILAYRIALTDNLLHPRSDLAFLKNPAGTRSAIAGMLRAECMRDMFTEASDSWQRTMRRRVSTLRVPDIFKDLFNLTVLLCHFDADVRRSVPSLSP